MLRKINERLKNSRGQSMLEYILIVIFVVVVGLAVWKTFGDTIKQMVTGTTNQITQSVQDTGVLNNNGN